MNELIQKLVAEDLRSEVSYQTLIPDGSFNTPLEIDHG